MNYLKKINLITVLLAVLIFTLGWQLGHRDLSLGLSNNHPTLNVVNRAAPKNVNVDFKLFWDTWDLVSQKYLDKTKIDPEKMFYGAIQGMVASIGDPYTVFLPPDAQKATSEELGGSFSGVGIELGYNKDNLNISLPDAVNQIRGPKGTQVTLTTFRVGDKETKDVKLTRDTIVVKSVTVSYKQSLPSVNGKTTQSAKKVALIKLSRFGERTPSEWDSAVSEILASGSAAMILDLRNNPGGFLDDAVYIGSEFLDGGNVVLQENYQKQRTPYPVNRMGKLLKLPMVVLINKGSASAAEIVAGALQDRKRAQLVGEQSFGKGTIQETADLEGGTGIHITTARWLTPNGRWVNDTEGLTPDVKVVLDPNSTDPTKDPQLDKALEILN